VYFLERTLETLICRYAVQQFLKTNESWTYTDWTSSTTAPRLKFAYRAVCDKNYYGPGCNATCISRNDRFGHYRCNPLDGSYVCLEGWTGNYCNQGTSTNNLIFQINYMNYDPHISLFKHSFVIIFAF